MAKRESAPVLFGRKMYAIRTYGYPAIWVLNIPPFSATLWQDSAKTWTGNVKVGIQEIRQAKPQTRAGVLRELERATAGFSRKLSRLVTNSQEGDEVR